MSRLSWVLFQGISRNDLSQFSVFFKGHSTCQQKVFSLAETSVLFFFWAPLTFRLCQKRPCSAEVCSLAHPDRWHWPRSPPEQTGTGSCNWQQHSAAGSWKRQTQFTFGQTSAKRRAGEQTDTQTQTHSLDQDPFNYGYRPAKAVLSVEVGPRVE